MLTPGRFVSVALVGALGAGAVLWLGAPAARTIPTGTGFTVAVAQSPSQPEARRIAARVAAVGLPAFTRASRRSHQVIAGPYASLDEADAVQRLLAKRGYKARVLVDESVRRPSGHDGTPVVSAAASVLLIAGAGSVAVVIELPSEPRHVVTRTVNAQEVEIIAGPVASRVESREWTAPAGVALLRSVSIDEAVEGTTRSLRARVTTPPSVQATVRTAARRIYIDLATPAPLPEAEELEFGGGVIASNRNRIVEDYRVTIAPLLERLETIEPFVMSAITQPAGEVQAALERSLRALQAWADEVTPPGQWQQSHEFIVSAVAKAAESVSASFTGDRTGKAREAFAMRDAAKRSLDPPGDQPDAPR